MNVLPALSNAITPHTCGAVIVTCIDFRFRNYIEQWTQKNYGDQGFDLVSFAGATKDLPTVMGQIDIAVRLHHVQNVVLIHHEDCGAYGELGTPKRHADDLYKAKQAILAKYPKLHVQLYYLHLDGAFEAIERYHARSYAT